MKHLAFRSSFSLIIISILQLQACQSRTKHAGEFELQNTRIRYVDSNKTVEVSGTRGYVCHRTCGDPLPIQPLDQCIQTRDEIYPEEAIIRGLKKVLNIAQYHIADDLELIERQLPQIDLDINSGTSGDIEFLKRVRDGLAQIVDIIKSIRSTEPLTQNDIKSYSDVNDRRDIIGQAIAAYKNEISLYKTLPQIGLDIRMVNASIASAFRSIERNLPLVYVRELNGNLCRTGNQNCPSYRSWFKVLGKPYSVVDSRFKETWYLRVLSLENDGEYLFSFHFSKSISDMTTEDVALFDYRPNNDLKGFCRF